MDNLHWTLLFTNKDVQRVLNVFVQRESIPQVHNLLTASFSGGNTRTSGRGTIPALYIYYIFWRHDEKEAYILWPTKKLRKLRKAASKILLYVSEISCLVSWLFLVEIIKDGCEIYSTVQNTLYSSKYFSPKQRKNPFPRLIFEGCLLVKVGMVEVKVTNNI